MTAKKSEYLRGLLEQMRYCEEHKKAEKKAYEIQAWNLAIDRAADWIDSGLLRSGDELKKQLKMPVS